MNSIRIVAAVLDTAKLTLYKTDGTTEVLIQGDKRIRRIIDEATPQILKQGFAEVSLAPVGEETGNAFQKFEETSTRVRLFRVAKSMLEKLFGVKDEPIQYVVGSVPQEKVDVAVAVTAETLETSHSVSVKSEVPLQRAATDTSVVDEIMANAQPVSHPEFNETGLDQQAAITDGNGITPNAPSVSTSSDTIIAVVDNKTIVPGMERIRTQFDKAAKMGSAVGVEKFLERIGKVIQQRKHSIDDLLKFMERGDLPIADDGTILIYKVLRRKTFQSYPLAKYADCYTMNVPQWIGSRVCMVAELVDPNRRNECSNGLHVARRGYVRNFNGDVCVMAKLAPEDVIAVPEYDANKMRVCGYNIIFELTPEQFELLRQNKPITNIESGQKLLARALKGDHTIMTHRVEITAQQGGGIQVTELVQKKKAEPVTDQPEPKKPLVPVEAIEDKADNTGPAVNPTEVAKVVEEVQQTVASKTVAPEPVVSVAEATPAQQESYSQRIAKLASITPMDLQTAQAILALKKRAKKGWEVLKVPDKIVEKVLKLTGQK